MINTIQVCSENEWTSLKSLSLVTNLITTPFGEAFDLSINNNNCVIFHGGSSKTKSAASCQYAIDTWKPNRHFVIGTAGGVANDIKELDIVIANQTALYDIIFRMGEPYEFIPVETIIQIDNSWFDFSKLPANTHEGFIASADQDVDFNTKLKLQTANVMAADWESGSIALICKINKVPCCIIRGITDIPIDSSEENLINQGDAFIKNTPKVMQKIFKEILFNII
jgi:adenosylhomocysteine nucleosidase